MAVLLFPDIYLKKSVPRPTAVLETYCGKKNKVLYPLLHCQSL
jgi:hypothetical protein